MTADVATTGWAALLRRDRAPATAILLGGILLHSMNVLLIATVLPSIVGDIGGAAQISWPTTAYVAASIVAASGAGVLVAAVGAKRAFVLGALIFAAGTLACALAPTMPQFVASRFVQGGGGGLLTATAYVLVRNVFPKALWPRAFALLAGVWGVSVLIGPLVGGAFATYGDWRDAFYALAVVACAIALFATVAMPATGAPTGPRPRLPLGRLVMVCLAIAAVSSAAIATSTLGKVALVVVGLGLTWGMLRLDRVATEPMLPSDAFRFGSATGVGLWTGFLALTAFAPMQVYTPVFLQTLHGLDPLAAGYGVAVASLAWTVAALVVAGLDGRWPGRLLVAGPLAMAAGLAAMAVLMAAGALWPVLAAVAVIGTGIGVCWAFVAQRIMAGARAGEEDAAAASVATAQQAGSAFGAAVAGAVANAAGFAGVVAGGNGADAAAAMFGAGALVALAAAAMGARLRRLAP